VFLAYPEIEASLGGSPPSPGQAPLGQRSWPMRVSVFYQPGMLPELPGTTIPDFPSILNQQPAATIWVQSPDGGGTPQSEWVGDLPFGGDLVPRTDGSSTLLVGPATTSP